MPAMSKVSGNAESRARLEKLCASLTTEQLSRKTSDGWTVAATLAHLAFWDRVTLERWKLFERDPQPVQFIFDVINDAGAADWHALQSREAVRLALESSTAVDAHIEHLSNELEKAARPIVSERLFERFHHRNEHLTAIEEALKAE
jgi:hypothetical protein